MYTNRYIIILGLGALVSLAACEAENDDTINPQPSNDSTQPDNTANNEGDGTEYNKTPFDQSETNRDVEVTAAIRRSIMNDDSMSMNAQNCKIMTEETGLVTLRGVVDSQAEKNAIDAMAKAVAGVTRVDNQLEVNTN